MPELADIDAPLSGVLEGMCSEMFENRILTTLRWGSRSAEMPHREEADLHRCRRAVEDTLLQLDWCIGYLHGIGKTTRRVPSRTTGAPSISRI